MFLGITKEKAVQHETVRKSAKDFIAKTIIRRLTTLIIRNNATTL